MGGRLQPWRRITRPRNMLKSRKVERRSRARIGLTQLRGDEVPLRSRQVGVRDWYARYPKRPCRARVHNCGGKHFPRRPCLAIVSADDGLSARKAIFAKPRI